MFEIFNETNEKIKEIDDVRRVLNVAIKIEKLENIEFNVIFVDNEYIHKLNKEYRNVDRETDVITFALEDNDKQINNDYRLLGDIYISLDKAKSQAIDYGHSLKREVCFLAVHGFLHLLGYDHINKSDEEVMFAKQEEFLNEANIQRD